MTALDLDWGQALEWGVRWERLEAPERARVIEAKPRQALRDVPRAEAERLLAAGIARPGGTANTLELAPDFHELHKLLRALSRTLIDGPGSAMSLATYLREALSAERRSVLLATRRPSYGGDLVGMLAERVGSAAHVRGFLSAPDRLAWMRQRDAPPPLQSWSHVRMPGNEPSVRDEEDVHDLSRLVEILIEVGGMTPGALAQRLPDLQPDRLGRAVRAALRCVLAVAGLDRELRLAIAVWPSVRERLLRAPAGPPAEAQPAEDFCLAWRLEDLTQLVVRAAEPLRVKADGRALFAAAEKSLESELAPLPEWLAEDRSLRAGRGPRLAVALARAQDLHLIERRGRSGRDLGLVTSRAGWSWLEQAPDDRLRGLLDLQRAAPAGEDDLDLPDLEDLLDLELDGDELDPYSGRRLAAWKLASASPFSPYGDPQVVRAAVAAGSSLELGRAVR
ncbi:MAG TPA: hypothetical protein VMS76_07760, partial [Planctomycetota bacterium]|nr:hypothetical protein [Planctomycetota bacterium]